MQEIRLWCEGGGGEASVSAEGGARRAEIDGACLAAVGRVLFDGRDALDPGVMGGVVSAFRQSPLQALSRLTGQYALVFADPAHRLAVAAVDRLGTWPLFVRETGDGGLQAASALRRLAGEEPRLDPQQIFNYLYFHVLPAPGCAAAGCSRLLPGEALVRHGVRQQRITHWKPSFRAERGLDRRAAATELRAAFHEGVERAVQGREVGAFLSGGTDSSTVVGALAGISESAPVAFSIGFDAEGYDERDYARLAARHFGARHHEYVVTPADVAEVVPRIAAAYEQPFGNASVVPTYFCARLARDAGVATLLGGDGGDELFGGNTRYAKQWLFSLYEGVPAPLRRALIEPLAQRGWLPRKLTSYVEQARVPLPDRMESYNLLRRLGFGAVLDPAVLDAVDVDEPLRLIRAAYGEADAGHRVDRMLARDLRFTLADDDLIKVRGGCALAGVEVEFPLLDEAVVDLSLRLPPEWKVQRTRLRPFFKAALADFLPAEVITKSKHGFGLPFGVWLVTEPCLRELAGDSLQSLKARKIVRAEFIDELQSGRLAEHPAYYGTMVWILMMLEQWYQAREERPALENVLP